MIDVLEPLAELQGLALAMLATPDGIPIVAIGPAVRGNAAKTARCGDEDTRSLEDALAAEAVRCLDEMSRAFSLVSKEMPGRVFLHCERASLVLQRSRNAVLLTVLSRGSAKSSTLLMDQVMDRVEQMAAGSGREPRVDPRRLLSPKPAA